MVNARRVFRLCEKDDRLDVNQGAFDIIDVCME